MSGEAPPEPLDLPAYLARIGFASKDQPPSAELLAGLHLAHATHIPFENLDILLGRPILLDLPSLQAKLVAGGRGGYCFEQNLLFAEALESLGFRVERLAARVRSSARRITPRNHMLLLAEPGAKPGEGAGPWLADVGFGGEGPLLPVPLGGEESRQGVWTYRVVPAEDRGEGVRALQTRRSDAWTDLYYFTREPQERVDYEVASYHTSTHPESGFVRTLTAQLPGLAERRFLRGRELVIDRGDALERRTIADDDEILAVLLESFGLRFPAGTRFVRSL
jgi:N-hydroxyarylamine O-acetyltransferase